MQVTCHGVWVRYNHRVMLDSFLVPDATVVTAKGDSEPLEISTAASCTFLLTLTIREVVEQESIEVTLATSADGTNWDPKPVAVYPQKFYPGQYPLLVDLSSAADAKFVRAHWEVSRWGRGATTPRFVLGLRIREVTSQELAEAQVEAMSRR